LLKESRSEVKGNDQRKEGKECGTFEPSKKDRPAKRKRCKSKQKTEGNTKSAITVFMVCSGTDYGNIGTMGVVGDRE
jgi:hypothetical protein